MYFALSLIILCIKRQPLPDFWAHINLLCNNYTWVSTPFYTYLVIWSLFGYRDFPPWDLSPIFFFRTKPSHHAILSRPHEVSIWAIHFFLWNKLKCCMHKHIGWCAVFAPPHINDFQDLFSWLQHSGARLFEPECDLCRGGTRAVMAAVCTLPRPHRRNRRGIAILRSQYKHASGVAHHPAHPHVRPKYTAKKHSVLIWKSITTVGTIIHTFSVLLIETNEGHIFAMKVRKMPQFILKIWQ